MADPIPYRNVRVVPSEAAVEDLVVSYWPTRWQKRASAPETAVQSGFTHSSKDPVSSWTKTGCGGVPMLTVVGVSKGI